MRGTNRKFNYNPRSQITPLRPVDCIENIA